MRTTAEINKRYIATEAEVRRISSILTNNPEIENEKYVFSNGTVHPGWTYKEALTAYVSEKSTLAWVLGKH